MRLIAREGIYPPQGINPLRWDYLMAWDKSPCVLQTMSWKNIFWTHLQVYFSSVQVQNVYSSSEPGSERTNYEFCLTVQNAMNFSTVTEQLMLAKTQQNNFIFYLLQSFKTIIILENTAFLHFSVPTVSFQMRVVSYSFLSAFPNAYSFLSGRLLPFQMRVGSYSFLLTCGFTCLSNCELVRNAACS